MKRVTSAEAARNFSKLSDLALGEPVVVTKNGRDRLVMLGVDEYNFLIDTIDELSVTRERARAPKLNRLRIVVTEGKRAAD
jgi:PHD/YefM family antitoxin component YafN of YafNO toxin-antitoxin module